jgi:hypothetical protein
MHSSIWRDEDLYRKVEEDNIYEDPNEAIYRVSSKAHIYLHYIQ